MATQFSVNDNIPWKTRFFAIWGGQAILIIGSQLVQFALNTTMPGDVLQSLA
jgi:hypothetical protein